MELVRLAAQVKLIAVLEVIEGKSSLVTVSKKYGCSRQSLALWIERFRLARSTFPEADEAKIALKVFQGAYKRGVSHPGSLAPRVERLVLDMVIKNPELNVRALALELALQKVAVSVASVYKILVRHNLQVRELRFAFASLHPAGTVYASRISPVFRKKLIEEYLGGDLSISVVCRKWSISRRTFYLWLKRYWEVATTEVDREAVITEALAKRYRRGFEHQRSIGAKAREAILEIIKKNPYYSVHKIYEVVKKAGNLASVGHQAIQNLLSRENLNTLARRLQYVGSFFVEPFVKVAPLYKPEMPQFKWRDLFMPFSPRRGLSALCVLTLPFLAIFFFFRMVSSASAGTSVVGLAFASIALFFGLFFFIYSMKYYISIFMVLRMAQNGGRA